ncbi:MAG: hypothetical protein RLY31_841 [Bacteroidota bacterium]
MDNRTLHSYCDRHTTLPVEVLHDLERETHLRTLSPQMMSGKVQGHLLYLLCSLQQPALALEIGTFTGYGAVCLAAGLPSHGCLHSIEINPELAEFPRHYLGQAGLADKVRLHIGDARTVIPTLPKPFDLVFIDAAKFDYLLYYEMVMDRVRSGGLILADNAIWGGKVLDPACQDADTRRMADFNRRVHEDPRVENLLLPVRDGLLVARKK